MSVIKLINLPAGDMRHTQPGQTFAIAI